jgi:cytochrome c oxidase subunit II
MLVVGLATLLAACDLPTFGAPHARSEQGKSITQLWQGFFLTAIAVALLVWGLLIYALIRYRHRRPKAASGDTDGTDAASDDDGIPSQRPYNIPLEIAYTAAPVVVVAVLFGFSVATQENVNRLDPHPAAVVEVVGFQWSWQFVYPDEHVTITGEPGQPPEMVLPVGEPSRLVLRSDDVDHSFWVPDFLSKRDLIPGVHNEIDVTPTETGRYVGRCAEFCGLDHWQMNFSVRVVPESEYRDWLDAQQRSAS